MLLLPEPEKLNLNLVFDNTQKSSLAFQFQKTNTQSSKLPEDYYDPDQPSKMPTKIPTLEKLKDKWYTFNEIFEENKLSLTYLLMIVLNQMVYGIAGKILTPTGTDLRFIYDVSQFTIDNLNTPLYTGFLFGSFANYLYAHFFFNRQITLVVFVLVIALCTALTPHVANIWILYAVQFANGLGFGVWEAGNSMWLIEVWPQRIAVLFQINQFAYNFGGALSYLLTSSFVYGDAPVDRHNRTLTPDDRRMSLAMPFSINGYLQSIIPLIFLALYFINRYQKRSLSKKIHNHNIDVFLPSVFVASNRTGKMLLCFTWVLIYLTAELAYINFFSTMYSSLPWYSPAEQQTINVIFLGAYSLGPLLTAFIAISFKLQNIILFNYALVAFSLVFLYFGLENVLFVYVCNLLLGLGYGPILPAMLAFAEISLQLNERNVSVYTFICGAAWLVTPFIARAGFAVTPYFLFYYNLACIPASAALYAVARWWLFHNSKKFSCYLENETNLKVCP